MRFTDEQAHEANSGIQIALGLLEPVRVQFPTISFADFHQVQVLKKKETSLVSCYLT